MIFSSISVKYSMSSGWMSFKRKVQVNRRESMSYISNVFFFNHVRKKFFVELTDWFVQFHLVRYSVSIISSNERIAVAEKIEQRRETIVLVTVAYEILVLQGRILAQFGSQLLHDQLILDLFVSDQFEENLLQSLQQIFEVVRTGEVSEIDLQGKTFDRSTRKTCWRLAIKTLLVQQFINFFIRLWANLKTLVSSNRMGAMRVEWNLQRNIDQSNFSDQTKKTSLSSFVPTRNLTDRLVSDALPSSTRIEPTDISFLVVLLNELRFNVIRSRRRWMSKRAQQMSSVDGRPVRQHKHNERPRWCLRRISFVDLIWKKKREKKSNSINHSSKESKRDQWKTKKTNQNCDARQSIFAFTFLSFVVVGFDALKQFIGVARRVISSTKRNEICFVRSRWNVLHLLDHFLGKAAVYRVDILGKRWTFFSFDFLNLNIDCRYKIEKTNQLDQWTFFSPPLVTNNLRAFGSWGRTFENWATTCFRMFGDASCNNGSRTGR